MSFKKLTLGGVVFGLTLATALFGITVPELEEMDRKTAESLASTEAGHPGRVELMNRKYLEALRKLEAERQKAGDLRALLVLRDDIKAFEETLGIGSGDSFPQLQLLREAYQKEAHRLEKTRLEARVSLFETHKLSLSNLLKKMTRENLIAEALEVEKAVKVAEVPLKKAREELKAWAEMEPAKAITPAPPSLVQKDASAPLVAGKTAANTLSSAEQNAGWKLLFDGVTTKGWEIYKKHTEPSGWKVSEGMLWLAEKGEGDLATTNDFTDFELVYDWKISPGANSGLMFRVTEQGNKSHESGMEMQIIDDKGQKDAQRAGAVYGLIAPPENVAKPVGEWNSARIVAKGAKIEMWLNGTVTAKLDLSSAEWSRLLAGSNFKSWPYFAKSPKGRIVLQDHGGTVWFRNVKLRPL